MQLYDRNAINWLSYRNISTQQNVFLHIYDPSSSCQYLLKYIISNNNMKRREKHISKSLVHQLARSSLFHLPHYRCRKDATSHRLHASWCAVVGYQNKPIAMRPFHVSLPELEWLVKVVV